MDVTQAVDVRLPICKVGGSSPGFLREHVEVSLGKTLNPILPTHVPMEKSTVACKIVKTKTCWVCVNVACSGQALQVQVFAPMSSFSLAAADKVWNGSENMWW